MTQGEKRCAHGNDPNWIPCRWHHPEQFAAFSGKPVTAEDRDQVAKAGAAMRGNTLQATKVNPRTLKLTGQKLAGCDVGAEAANATQSTRFHVVMFCGHAGILSGTDLKQAEKAGKKLRCRSCARAFRAEEKKSKKRNGATDVS